MITKMAESPTSASASSSFQTAALQQYPVCCSPKESTTTDVCRDAGKRGGSPRSPTQESLCQKRSRNRHAPYHNNKSPGGSSTSSDDSVGDGRDGECVSQAESKVKRIQANTRERKRMHTVNSAFDQLRELVPTYPSNRKLSKIDTLRLACTYIQDLVSVLHQTRSIQGLQGDDVTQYPMFGADGYIPGPYSAINVKTETMADYPSFTNYRMPVSNGFASNCESDYSTSETETHSPPYLPVSSALPGIGVRPPPLSRTSSDSAAHLHRQMSHGTISAHTVTNGGPSYSQSTQRLVNIPSPLATHSVQHSTPPLVSSELPLHQSPPVWQRCGSVPTGYPLYGQ